LLAVIGAHAERVDVARGCVVVVAGLRIDAAHRADHLRGEQDVVGRDHLEEEIDAGLVIDAGVEEHVVQQVVLQQRLLEILGDPAIAAPVVGRSPAAVGNDELEARKVLEEVAGDQLHERGRVAADVVAAGRVEVGIARHAHVDHRRHIELDQLLVDRVPPLVGQRRILPVPARRVRIQVAADEAELLHAALELRDAVGRRHARRLRQLADAHEVLREERAHPVDQVVADLRPVKARRRVADMMTHPGSTRREDRDIRAALFLELELSFVDRFSDLIVADADGALRAGARGLFQLGDLLLAVRLELLGSRRVVAVTVDDHEAPPAVCEWARLLVRGRSERNQSPAAAQSCPPRMTRAMPAATSASCSMKPWGERPTHASILLWLPAGSPGPPVTVTTCLRTPLVWSATLVIIVAGERRHVSAAWPTTSTGTRIFSSGGSQTVCEGRGRSRLCEPTVSAEVRPTPSGAAGPGSREATLAAEIVPRLVPITQTGPFVRARTSSITRPRSSACLV